MKVARNVEGISLSQRHSGKTAARTPEARGAVTMNNTRPQFRRCATEMPDTTVATPITPAASGIRKVSGSLQRATSPPITVGTPRAKAPTAVTRKQIQPEL